MNDKQKNKLVNAAMDAAKNAFVLTTNTKTGAAILTLEDEIYVGCNVQSVISGLGTCAERCAIYNAVAHGKYNFKAIAVYFPIEKTVKPCGVCLQLIYEFSEVVDKDIELLLVNNNNDVVETTIHTIFPDGYGPRSSGKDLKNYAKKK